ncbi:hypothetical protein UT300003_32610 [Clostridium sardiniense]
MIIKAGSKIKITDGFYNKNCIIDEIIAQEDINFENDGKGYSFLLRNSESNSNSIFVADKIEKLRDCYVIEGCFKDSILVIEDRYGNEMHESYLQYD